MPDGRLVVYSQVSERLGAHREQRIGIARLNPDGSFDTTFGDGGAIDRNMLSESFGPRFWQYSSGHGGFEVLPDSTLIVHGEAFNANDEFRRVLGRR